MVTLQNVSKTYRTKQGDLDALHGITINIEKGRFVLLSGPSGSGKTTLLMTIAAMLTPTAGTVQIDNTDIYKLNPRSRAAFRADKIGFVFQMFHLVPYLNIVENILLAARPSNRSAARQAAQDLLTRFGLADRATHKPAELSAGEKQRAAIARAVFNRPEIILADEPTGNLDPENAAVVLEHLAEFNRRGGTVILATHGRDARQFAHQTINLKNGTLRNP
ncbi:MAG: ABC transporter ATP-binding protein [Sedimentisphaerales bacterium]|nr:ABC transporter ATP-binding protein [Sedimentisphaerales bacterium]